MNNQSVLVNFNVPNSTKYRFDKVCHLTGRTRTSVLVELMNGYILSQSDQLSLLSNRMDRIDQALASTDARSTGYDEPLAFFGTHDDGGW
jgi:predicted DNA-binding protein